MTRWASKHRPKHSGIADRSARSNLNPDDDSAALADLIPQRYSTMSNTRMSLLLNRLFLVLVTFTVAPFASAQPITFTRPATTADLTPAQQAALDRLRAERTTQSISVVEVEPSALATAGSKTLQLNRLDATGLNQMTVTGMNRLTTQDGRSFSGRPTGDPTGYSTFVVSEGKVTGSYTVGNQQFKIRPLGGNKHAVIEINSAAFPPDHSPSAPKPQPASAPKKTSLQDTGDGKLVALIFFTEAASAKVGGDDEARAVIKDAVVKTNLSYSNSGLSFTLSIAPAEPIKSKYKENGGVSGSLAALAAGKEALFGSISDLRTKHKADIVVLVTDDSDACGEAKEIDADKSAALAVVTIECAADNFSLAHEVGHLQGARHDMANDSTPGDNHGYCDSTKMKRTIMAYACAAGLRRSAQWSRPKDWGKEGENNNTKKLKETHSRISNYY